MDKHPEYQYLDLLKDILENWSLKHDHNTWNGLVSVFGRQIRFDLSKGFPLLTTKKTYWHGILHELCWFLSWDSNIKYLVDNNVHIWDDYPYKIYSKKADKWEFPTMTKQEFIDKIKNDADFAKMHGDLPMVYGEQWRKWKAWDGRRIDQLQWVVDNIRDFPDRKSTLMSVWNPEFLYQMALPGKALSYPLCHVLTHYNVSNWKLSVQLYQRSADMFLWVPFNIASYSLLTLLLCKITGLEPWDFVHTFGDAHIYENHFDQVKEQITREPKPLPTIKLDDRIVSLDTIKPEYITLENYESWPMLKWEMTVAWWFDEKDRKKS